MGGIVLFILISLIATCLIEGLCLLLFGKRKWLKVSLLCNVLTNPLLNTMMLIVSLYIDNEIVRLIILIVLEIVVIFAEAKIYQILLKESFKKCLSVSFFSNVASCAVGLFTAVEDYKMSHTTSNTFGEIY